MKETVHSDFETIVREDQEYRISTKVEYRVDQDNYKCRAKLFKSYNGRIRDAHRNLIYKQSVHVSNKEKIDSALSECVESCREKLDEFEDAKDVSVKVNITDG